MESRALYWPFWSRKLGPWPHTLSPHYFVDNSVVVYYIKVVYCVIVIIIYGFILTTSLSWLVRVLVKYWINGFGKILLQIYAFLKLFSSKNAENDYLTIVWSAQHPNTGRNIQQTFYQNIDQSSYPSFLFGET